MKAGQRVIQIPFTVGDEHEREHQRSLCCLVDVVVPPRTAYVIPTLPHDSAGKPGRLHAQEQWQVLAREDREHQTLETEWEELQQRQQQRQGWHEQ